MERSIHHNRVAHFDETQPTSQSTSVESEELNVKHYSKTLLNDTVEPTHQKTSAHVPEKSIKKQEVKQEVKKHETTTVVHTNVHVPKPTHKLPQASEIPIERMGSDPHTAIAPTYQQKQFATSTYYPMPTIGEKQKSPEKAKPARKVDNTDEKKRKKDQNEKPVINGPNVRHQLTPEDLEYIKRSVQQRNERRAFMMAHRNETDDTLYELEVRMPEKDYTNRMEVGQNYRVC